MKFFVIIFVLNGIIEITFKVNKDFFIREVHFTNGFIPNYPVTKTKVIDFNKGKKFLINYGDSIIQSSDFKIEDYLGNWSVKEIEIDTIIESTKFYKKNEFDIECIERITKRRSHFNVNSGEELNRIGTEISIIGNIDEVFNYLPDSSYANLLKPAFLGGKQFCFESYDVDKGRRILNGKIINISVEKGELPFDIQD